MVSEVFVIIITNNNIIIVNIVVIIIITIIIIIPVFYERMSVSCDFPCYLKIKGLFEYTTILHIFIFVVI